MEPLLILAGPTAINDRDDLCGRDDPGDLCDLPNHHASTRRDDGDLAPSRSAIHAHLLQWK